MTDPVDSEPGPSVSADRTRADQNPAGDGAASAHPLEPLIKHLTELREFALHYLEARKDQAKAAAQRILIQLVLACLAGVTGIAVFVTAIILVLTGLAEVAGDLLGGRAWAGQLVVGGGTLLASGALFWVATTVRTGNARQQTKQKYERRHHAQRVRFGEDVAERASS